MTYTHTFNHPHITLHDQAALAALEGLSANPSACGSHEDIATSAWKTADAFMAEREKRLKDEDAEEKKP